MNNPLTQVTYNQEPGYMAISLVPGDDLSVTINLPFAITGYTFSGTVYDSLGNSLTTFTPTISQSTPSGIVVATLSKSQTALCIPGTTYAISWTVSGAKRTFLAGPFQ